MANSVTPRQGNSITISVGGQAVMAIPPGVNGGYIVNPSSPSDQNIGGGVEDLYVDPVISNPTLLAFGTTAAVGPGSPFQAIPNSTTGLYVNAATAGHRFTAVWW